MGRFALTLTLALRNLVTDRFATLSSIAGVALGAATVNVVLILDVNTRAMESRRWTTNPDLPVATQTVRLTGILASGAPSIQADPKKETHEDYQVMRSAIRLGSLAAFLVGALIVFFTFRVVVEERRREIALLRSLGATPRQVASVFLTEAAIVGVIGAVLGFMIAPPLSYAAALAGITTTGRSVLRWLWFPWGLMAGVSAIGAITAVLGVARPLWEVLRLDVPRTLRPRFLESPGEIRRLGKKTSGVTLIALPFMALLYITIRPFFVEVLPSLAFFVLEAGAVCAGFLGLIVLVPELVRFLGRVVAVVLPRRPMAPRLLELRRIERSGHELAWSVSGVMLVFALLLALHIVTHALGLEVVDWAEGALRTRAFAYSRDRAIPERLLRQLPPELVTARFSGRTPWPSSLLAVPEEELVALAELDGEPNLSVARALGRGKVILSTMMAQRYAIGVGDLLEVEGRTRTARLEVVAVTDAIGYVPMVGPYRSSKTYGLIGASDLDLIEGYASPIGTGLVMKHRGAEPSSERWAELLAPLRSRPIRVEVGRELEAERVRETHKDFAIFDVILLLTGLLAAIGIANNLVLSAHMRQREIALYRVLGMDRRQLRALFSMEGGLIGLLGGVLAVALGVPLGIAALGALQVISAFRVRFELPWSYALATIGGAIVVSLIAALHPATRATELSGAESVHYE